MKFVWITENYRVNIESIFSLEKKEDVNPKLREWVNQYESLLNNYKLKLPPLIDNDGTQIILTNESTDEDIKKYSKLIKELIYDQIGEKPEEYVYQYTIILSTGLKINIGENKYKEINRIIDNNQILSDKLNKELLNN